MRVLWVGTKEPVPPTDGGRLLTLRSLEALRDLGVEVTFVAPVAPSDLESASRRLDGVCRPRLVVGRPLSASSSLLGALRQGLPMLVARHTHETVKERVGRLLDAESFDVVHVEQVQAMGVAPVVRAAGAPLVLRSQNVESDLWRADLQRRLPSALAHLWSRRLARWEGRAVAGTDRTIALTEPDAVRLRELSESGRVVAQPVPFPPRLSPAPSLGGEPSVVAFSGGWWPNSLGVDDFLRRGWPRVLQRFPGARLHCFGGTERAGAGVEWHPAPEDSRVVFARGSIHLVPLQVASGVRMKILEAAARGVVVVASRVAARGLEGAPESYLGVADDSPSMADVVCEVAASDDRRAALVRGSREALAEHHDPRRWAERTVALYATS